MFSFFHLSHDNDILKLILKIILRGKNFLEYILLILLIVTLLKENHLTHHKNNR